jgi:electron transfer flavoprotein beta subunit
MSAVLVAVKGVGDKINPFDHVALEEAVRLKEKGLVSEVIATSIGDSSAQTILRTALALGADRAIHVNTPYETQPLGVAHALKALVEREHPRLVLMGEQAVDDNFNQTGQMLAALLGWPQGTNSSSLEVRAESIRIIHQVDEGLETLEIRLPAVVTVDLHLNQPRYASLPQIMEARQKPLELLTAEALGVDMTPRLQFLQVSPPPSRKPVVMVPDVDGLLEKLRNEVQVI